MASMHLEGNQILSISLLPSLLGCIFVEQETNICAIKYLIFLPTVLT